jgi:long-chain acyl-CoA synthetase
LFQVFIFLSSINFVQDKKALLSKFEGSNLEEICDKEEAKKFVLDSLSTCGKEAGLKSIEMIRGVILIPEAWTPENGKLTAAQKVKRKDISEEYHDKIDELYKSSKMSSSE